MAYVRVPEVTVDFESDDEGDDYVSRRMENHISGAVHVVRHHRQQRGALRTAPVLQKFDRFLLSSTSSHPGDIDVRRVL